MTHLSRETVTESFQSVAKICPPDALPVTKYRWKTTDERPIKYRLSGQNRHPVNIIIEKPTWCCRQLTHFSNWIGSKLAVFSSRQSWRRRITLWNLGGKEAGHGTMKYYEIFPITMLKNWLLPPTPIDPKISDITSDHDHPWEANWLMSLAAILMFGEPYQHRSIMKVNSNLHSCVSQSWILNLMSNCLCLIKVSSTSSFI